MGIPIYLNEKECRPVMIKAYPQCQSDRMIYSFADGILGTAPELVSDAPAYCLQVPMELGQKRGGAPTEVRLRSCVT
ncbi:hypothetical protein TNCV_1213541 [Trichonephila clavipes]|nr:hypothetical protein TNCV_1213541 [Trichonephila clavipes]